MDFTVGPISMYGEHENSSYQNKIDSMVLYIINTIKKWDNTNLLLNAIHGRIMHVLNTNENKKEVYKFLKKVEQNVLNVDKMGLGEYVTKISIYAWNEDNPFCQIRRRYIYDNVMKELNGEFTQEQIDSIFNLIFHYN